MKQQSENKADAPATPAATKRAWVQPQLKRVGHVSEVLQGGGGKISPAADPGDGRKQRSQG